MRDIANGLVGDMGRVKDKMTGGELLKELRSQVSKSSRIKTRLVLEKVTKTQKIKIIEE